MSLNRFFIDPVIIILVMSARPPGERLALLSMAFHVCCSIALFAHILVVPRASPPRRIIASVLDLGTISIQIGLTGAVGAALYPFYLWVILGYGFRFGLNYLAVAMGVAITGFATDIMVSRYWQQEPFLSYGLLLGLLLVPAYASTLIRKLSAAKRQAEQASQAKTLFLASVSHELRTPLNAVIGMGGLLSATPLNAEQRDMTGTIDSAAKALLQQIDGILDFLRLETGHFVAERNDFDLLDLLGELRDLVAPQARAKSVRLALFIPADTGLSIRADRRHLQTILLNLLANAVKFTEGGFVSLAVTTAGPTAVGAVLRFEVSDTGIGIASESVGHIFDSFTQADESIRNRFGGTGLGLATCKLLVNLLGGEIGVDSAPGVGSSFWFTIPVDHPPPGADHAVPATGPKFRRATMLSADPASTGGIQASLARRLAREAITLVAAPPGAEIAPDMIYFADAAMLGTASFVAWFEHATAASAAAASLLGRTPLIAAVGGPPGPGLIQAAQRSMIRTCVDPDADAAEIRAALRIFAAWPDSGGRDDGQLPLFQPIRSLHILVADDNRTNQKVIGKILTSAGHRASFASDGSEALEALAEPDFDLVLMDVNMPGMTGIEVTQLHRFAELGQGRASGMVAHAGHLPILALTADATPEMAQRCIDAGMDACVIKPVAPNDLLAAIDTHANGSPPAATAPPTGGATGDEWDTTTYPIIDWAALNGLRRLGGEQFVIELLDEIQREAEELGERLAANTRAVDAEDFRANAHALQSSAANVGAKSLSELCRSWRHTTRSDLQAKGEDRLNKLYAALKAVESRLSERRPVGQSPDPHT
jgi:two-component system sensor histidine kinase RpfC